LEDLAWTPRQVGILLGLSEATIKRMVAKGGLASEKDGRVWRTPARAVIEKLREGKRAVASLREAAALGDDAECLAQLVEQRSAGRGLGNLFDELLTYGVPLSFLERAQPLAELPEAKGRRAVRAAMLNGAGTVSRMAACLFRARRIEVLTTLRQLDDEGAAALVRQSRPDWFWAGDSSLDLPLLEAAARQSGCRLLRLGSDPKGETIIAGFEELERLLVNAS
jgi:hypothetical protein